MSPLRRLVIGLLWLAVIGAYLAAIAPQADAPSLGQSDKFDHVAAFFTVAMLARLAYRERSAITLYILIVDFGGLIELSQAMPFIGRDAQWSDWLADAVAALVGVLAAWPLVILAERRRVRRASASGQPIERKSQPQP